MKLRAHKFTIIAVVVSVTGLVAAMTYEFAPRLIWNATPSAPIGLYKVEQKPPAIGDFALVMPSGSAEKLIYDRGYLPPGIPLLKRVAAMSGDKICRTKDIVFVNNYQVANALFADSNGRKMPRWNGCFTLQSHEFFLLNDHEKSLDGRYFRATNESQIIGVAIPVFIRGSDE